MTGKVLHLQQQCHDWSHACSSGNHTAQQDLRTESRANVVLNCKPLKKLRAIFLSCMEKLRKVSSLCEAEVTLSSEHRLGRVPGSKTQHLKRALTELLSYQHLRMAAAPQQNETWISPDVVTFSHITAKHEISTNPPAWLNKAILVNGK